MQICGRQFGNLPLLLLLVQPCTFSLNRIRKKKEIIIGHWAKSYLILSYFKVIVYKSYSSVLQGF